MPRGRYTRPTAVERFWAKVDRRGDDECWEWTASRSAGGYGRFWPTRDKRVPAHRFAYELFVGPVPNGLELDHLCKNRACVNPFHLEAVTPEENNWRSGSPTALNSRKTRCKRGHPLSGPNVYRTPRGRHCRECQRLHQRRYDARIRSRSIRGDR